jgi:hypothetical protein
MTLSRAEPHAHTGTGTIRARRAARGGVGEQAECAHHDEHQVTRVRVCVCLCVCASAMNITYDSGGGSHGVKGALTPEAALTAVTLAARALPPQIISFERPQAGRLATVIVLDQGDEAVRDDV